MPNDRPLFIPLKAEHFEAFLSGAKAEEFRLLGPRWNEKTVWIGRAVTISFGYTARRLHGVVTSLRTENNTWKLPGFIECYGGQEAGPAICIGIALNPGGTP